MIKGETKSGFKFKYPEKKLDNMRLMDKLKVIYKEDDEAVFAFSDALEMLLGAEQKERLYDHLADKDGDVPAEKVGEAFGDILNAGEEHAKNLKSSPK